MAIRYYDEALYNKLKNWLPDTLGAYILKPDETSRLFRLQDDANKDEPLTLPLIALSRDSNIELLEVTKSPLSFNGKKIAGSGEDSILVNAIPVSIFYQIDIYSHRQEEADTILRELIFKLKNNPKMVVTLPYNGINLEHVAYTRLASTITDNSDISERLVEGQFTRWTFQLEITDAYLFSIPIKENYKLEINDKYVIVVDEEDNSHIEYM